MKTEMFTQSRLDAPNMLIYGAFGNYDLTATFARIQREYGSAVVPPGFTAEQAAAARQAQQDQLKLLCVKYAVTGPDENDPEGDTKARHWLLPIFPHFQEEHYMTYGQLITRLAEVINKSDEEEAECSTSL